LKVLDKELPPLPVEITVVKENPPPYNIPKKIIGSEMPKAEDDDKKKKGEDKPKTAKKKS